MREPNMLQILLYQEYQTFYCFIKPKLKQEENHLYSQPCMYPLAKELLNCFIIIFVT